MEIVQIIFLSLLGLGSFGSWVTVLFSKTIVTKNLFISLAFLVSMIQMLINFTLLSANNRLLEHKKEKYEEVTITLYKKIK